MSDAASATATRSLAGFPEGAEGVTPPTNPEGTGGFLSDVIVELGFVDRETVERAAEAAREPGRVVDRILLESDALTEEQLSRALAERHGLDHVDLDRFEVDMRAASLISRTIALRYRAIPIAFASDGALILAVADPVDALAISDLEVMTKTETRRVVASGASIDALAERLPEVGARQPAPNDHHPVDEVSTPSPSPASPTTGSNSQPSPASPATKAPRDPRSGNGNGKAQDVLREQAGQAEAERGRLQEQATEAVRESDRLREALDQVTKERDRLTEEAQRRSADFEALLEQAKRAESLAEEAAGRRHELEDADRRAEAARQALNELREESEREREQSSRLERKLREELTVAEQRIASLERRLSGLMAAAAEAKVMAEELASVHGAIGGDDIPPA